jgi:hypothetical protein
VIRFGRFCDRSGLGCTYAVEMTRRQAAVGLGIVVLDLVISVCVGVAMHAQFLVWSVEKSNPPLCLNYFDDRVDCSLDSSTAAISVAVMAVTFLVLVLAEFLIWRRRSAVR